MNRRALVRLALALTLVAGLALAQDRRLLQISARFDGTDQVAQRVQVLEGRPAVIYSNRSRPVRQRIHTPAGVVAQEVTVVHDQATGFQVVPRLSGRTVQLEIPAQAGAAHTATTVQAELGQWVHLGSASRMGAYRSEMQDVWLKVEEMPN